MQYLPKRFFQFLLFIVWSLTLIYLLSLSIVTLILLNICLFVFLFWLILTLIGWSIGFIPILTFVFIPWYRRHCRLWTLKEKQSRLSVAFFHPYCDNDHDQEQVLWYAIQSILRKYKHDVQILVYTGNRQVQSKDEVFQRIKRYFDIDLKSSKSSIEFIPLRSRFLLEKKYYKICTLLGQSIGSIIVSLEALIRFIPDIFIDTAGYSFTYLCFHYLASIPIISYVHSPAITSHLIQSTNDHDDYGKDNSILYQIELFYYQLITYVDRWCIRCAKVIYCNSSWTKKYLELTSAHVLYPPCDIEQFPDVIVTDRDPVFVSIGRFQKETQHELQIRTFNELLQRKSKDYPKLKLVLIGYSKRDEEKAYLEQLQLLVEDLNIQDKVVFKVNISFNETKAELAQAMVGLHTRKDQAFDINLVRMMAAGLIVLGHQSGGTQMDIIDDEQTGFLACDVDSYVTNMEKLMEMTNDERCDIHNHVRERIDRFNRLNFERFFTELFDKIFYVK
ncbi:unnamed protein product [Adineta ricciae]|uniref:GDP-Man:Man(3)GlcNAc(2)-PP-Dol alpha-1,2-mannosyltransferase n=1 Tax=Adineta ricciae TaxID=249248 RepID=A0A813WAR9_ADIRI|nr:unnamed protein product [Adineta ricciae]